MKKKSQRGDLDSSHNQTKSKTEIILFRLYMIEFLI